MTLHVKHLKTVQHKVGIPHNKKRRTKEFETIYTYMKMVYEFEYSLLYSDDINSFNLRGFSALQIQL